ncbi:50S ribosomal protein L4 [Cerasicoccus maritimus]|uniref:50S ribosomal protein L4 n=1 Tax=Cerasicoccus maritimus TaxID=490089 RepID=UPI0028528164|nr:50S ribosomal protein L4 [Cerasicoccus maritimus]
MKLKVFTADGASSTEKEYAIPTFEGDKGLQALKDVVVAYQSNLRQGNAKSKTRGEVRGTGKKVYRQKGTGHARHGDRQSPIYVGGGTAHGPKLRDWTKHANKKVKTLAMRRALFDKATDGELSVIEKFELAAPKTKDFDKIISQIKPEGKILIVDQQFDDNTALSARNLARVHITDSASLNAWDLVRFDNVVISEKGIEQVLARTGEGK